MPDAFATYKTGLESPASNLDPVTPDDAIDLPQTCRALNVAGAGVIRLTTANGSVATVYVAAGIAFPVRARRVWATNTTATGIVAMW